MPILESMIMGVPIVAPNHTGMKELLADERGFAIEPSFTFIDTFGNGNRYLVEVQPFVNALKQIADPTDKESEQRALKARVYAESLSWETTIAKTDKLLRRIYEQTKPQAPSIDSSTVQPV